MKKSLIIVCTLLMQTALAETAWNGIRFTSTTDATTIYAPTGSTSFDDIVRSTLSSSNSTLTWDTTALGETMTNYAISFSVNTTSSGNVFTTNSSGTTRSGLGIYVGDGTITIKGGPSCGTTLSGAPALTFTSDAVYTFAVYEQKAYLILGDTLPSSWTTASVSAGGDWAHLSSTSKGWSNSGATPITIYGVINLDTASAIPEPATATLSLLALAGLAARRRRK